MKSTRQQKPSKPKGNKPFFEKQSGPSFFEPKEKRVDLAASDHQHSNSTNQAVGKSSQAMGAPAIQSRPFMPASMIQRQPQRIGGQTNRLETCLADQDNLLPGGVGILTHIMREGELTDALGNERLLLEQQIQANPAARRFVCEAGVPAMIALYDTRRARVRLEVSCARQALAFHPTHYTHTALTQGRHLLLKPAFTSFRRRTPLFLNASERAPLAHLEVGRRLQLLSPDLDQGRQQVRVISGPHHCLEGYVEVSRLGATPTATSIQAPRKVRLVFMENPERLNRTILGVRAGLTSRRTQIRVPQTEGRDRYHAVPANRKFSVNSSGHTETELHVSMRVPGQSSRVTGFLPRGHTMNDLDHRMSERRFFMSVARRIARERRSIFVDPASQTCVSEAHPIEFFNGQDIARAIVGAANCTDVLVDEIHIVGHGGTHGMPGTGDYADYTGLYIREYNHTISKKPGAGAMDVRAFAEATKGALANGIQVWLHACRTAENYMNEVRATEELAGLPRTAGFAEQLAGELRRSGHTEATVGGLRGIGPADSGYVGRKRFVVYPGGSRTSIAPLRRGE